MTEPKEQSRGLIATSRWNPKVHPAVAIIVIAAALAGVVYLIVRVNQATDKAWREEIAVVNERPFIEPGSRVTLTTGLVATDRRTLRDTTDALANHNKAAFDYLYMSRKIFSVAKQTPVLILENSDGESRVRILDGKYRGIEGWVSDNWFR